MFVMITAGKITRKELFNLGFKKTTIKKTVDKLQDVKMINVEHLGNEDVYIAQKNGHELLRNIRNIFLLTKVCQACNKNEVHSSHHWLPKRQFGDNPFTIEMCEKCHNEIEIILDNYGELSVEQYARILFDFIQNKDS